jgi:large subunit ribosomal protein L1
MGKTKTAFVGGVSEAKLSSEEKYKQKLAKKKAEEELKKVGGLGLKGGARIKIVGATSAEEIPASDAKDATKQAEEVPQGSDIPESELKEKKLKIRGKNYKSARSKTDRDKLYQIPDALKLIKGLVYAKFDETYELHIVTKKTGFNVNLTLPHSFGKKKKVEVASDETIENLKKGKISFDVLLSTPEMMPKLVVFAKLLGPKGLMPNPKSGTIIKNEKEAEKYAIDQKVVRTEKDQPVIHTTVGKMSMDEKEVIENIQAVINAITKIQIVKIYLKSTMSPSLKLAI